MYLPTTVTLVWLLKFVPDSFNTIWQKNKSLSFILTSVIMSENLLLMLYKPASYPGPYLSFNPPKISNPTSISPNAIIGPFLQTTTKSSSLVLTLHGRTPLLPLWRTTCGFVSTIGLDTCSVPYIKFGKDIKRNRKKKIYIHSTIFF